MEQKITSYFIRHGLIYAIISILMALLLYLAGADFFANNLYKLMFFFLLVAIAYPTYALIQFRKQNGEMSFKQGFMITFFTLAVAGLVTLLFGILLYNVIDTDYPKVMAEKINERTLETMQNWGVPEDQIEEQMAKSDASEKFTIGGQVQDYLVSLVIYAVLGLILGAILKRTKPMSFDSQS